jgi:hypothetical protein
MPSGLPGPESASPLWSKTPKVSPCLSVRGRRSCSEAVAGIKNWALVRTAAGSPASTAAAYMLASFVRR